MWNVALNPSKWMKHTQKNLEKRQKHTDLSMLEPTLEGNKSQVNAETFMMSSWLSVYRDKKKIVGSKHWLQTLLQLGMQTRSLHIEDLYSIEKVAMLIPCDTKRVTELTGI